jgi:hypothetical protein
MNLAVMPQETPEFPLQDLSEDNADVLELMLANAEIVTQGHVYAEKTSWVYRAGHPVLLVALKSLFDDREHIHALDHGIRSYEATAWLTKSITEHCDMFTINAHACTLASQLGETGLSAHIDHAVQKFTTELPRTAHVIAQSSARFYPALSQFAVAGAALTRQFAIDTLE